MAVVKSTSQAPLGIDALAEADDETPVSVEAEIEIEIVDDEEGDDEFELLDMLTGEPAFDDNLADYLDEGELVEVAANILDGVESDEQSRADWMRTYRDGLDMLGLRVEDRTEPWAGASGVYHPVLAEAVVKFQSETIVETFPTKGPTKTKIIGQVTPEKEIIAKRVQEDMNYRLTEKMADYRKEHERMLWHLPIAGAAFKKIYFDEDTGQPASQFVPAEDFIASYGCSDLKTAERYTHRMRKSNNEIRKLQVSGFYRNIDLGEPAQETNEVDEMKDELQGVDALNDERHILYEVHCNLDLPGFEDTNEDGEYTGIEIPYIVTINKSTGDVLSIYRNWEEDDKKKNKRIHFSHYTYIPGFGFYGYGLIHLIGGFTKSATSLLRQLIDAGTLANLQGGFKTRGLRIRGGDSPISPGEYRDVDVPTGTIKDNIMSLPYKEPSLVLQSLLGQVVDEARRFASVADLNVSDMQPNAPVGSTLAILERQLKTMSAVQARLYDSMKYELKLIKAIVAVTAPEDYEYNAVGQEPKGARQSDYADVDIIPVSDPNASTMSQRIVQHQAVMQMAEQNPQIYDMAMLHRQMLDVLGVDNAEKILPTKDDLKPMDPVTENMRLLNGDPIRAHMYQDHEAHIAAHMAFGQDPKIQKMLEMQGPAAQAKMAAGMAHINEHLAFKYRADLEKQLGVELPTWDEDNQTIPEEVEVGLSRIVAEAANKLLGRNTQEEQAKQAQQAAEDPVLKQQQEEIELKKVEELRKQLKDERDYELELMKLYQKHKESEDKNEAEGMKLGATISANLQKAQSERERTEQQLEQAGLNAGVQIRQQDVQREQAAQQAAQVPQQVVGSNGG